MKLNASYLLAGVAVLAIGAWFVVGSADNDRDIYDDVQARDAAATQAPALPTVVVRSVTSETHPIRLTQYGR
ncbi:MAG: hypothetical protein WBA35_13210, partial [Litorimonas sp.]